MTKNAQITHFTCISSSVQKNANNLDHQIKFIYLTFNSNR